MKTIIIIVMFTASIAAQENKIPSAVDNVDLSRYAGLWYEIAKIPNRFQKSCIKNVKAEYSLNKDGSIAVKNSCVEEDGEINIANGTARIADKKTNAKLEVSFVSIFGWNLFWGDYWIIGLADDYSYAVIGHPEKKYGWILSRTQSLTEDKMKEAFTILEKSGYKKSDFKMTLQD